jgi:Uma2 family endonuclease
MLIVGGKAADVYYETDAALIAEVRSPSTADVDRREKAVAYLTLPSMEHYLLVDPVYRRVEVATRTADGWQWTVHGPGATVLTPYGDLRVDELYDDVDAVSST